MNRLLTLITLLSVTATAISAPLDTMTGIFNEKFRSLQVRVAGSPFAPPIITLFTDDCIEISFDELADSRSYLRYQLVHCNADWQPSGLVESEYLEGFNFGNIDNWDYSRMTLTNYIHYNIVIPNPEMQFTVSGNYLLQVYQEEDPDTILLQTRFMVSEATASVSGDVLSVTDIDYNDSHQQVSVAVDATNAKVEDIFNDLMVYVSQNGRLDNEIMVRQPLRTSGRTAFYEHLLPLIFKAGNEYRRMETVSRNYPGMGVASIDYFDPYYHATLQTDLPRSEERYSYDETQHGRYFIREYNSDRSELEADYFVTHFTLDLPEQPGCNIFLDGDFVSRRFDPSSIMTYNRATGLYEKTLLLKQGAYNYQYLLVEPGKRSGDTAPIEGDRFQTRNEYTVKVYHRRRGERYDRLIGATTLFF